MSDDRLSLTLDEIVHIRSVLTKAELEVLPVEGRVKEDVEKRRVSNVYMLLIIIYCTISGFLGLPDVLLVNTRHRLSGKELFNSHSP